MFEEQFMVKWVFPLLFQQVITIQYMISNITEEKNPKQWSQNVDPFYFLEMRRYVCRDDIGLKRLSVSKQVL